MSAQAAQAAAQSHDLLWIAIGLFGQGMFMMRFVIQWISSERARQSIIPEAFWYFSLAGGAIVLAYGIHKTDPVIIVGQCTGLFIYLRNIYFIRRRKRDLRTVEAKAPSS